jgi:3-hydroxyisobutyrate dehydrogenase
MCSNPKVGWIGLGAIGAPMARAAARSGIDVTVFDLDPQAVADMSDVATSAASAQAAVSGADVVVIMVATPLQLHSVVFGVGGIVDALSSSSTLLIMSTVGPAAIDQLATGLRDIGTGVVDAPVSGGVARAAAGDLLVMVSGEDGDVERVRPVIDALASSSPTVGSRAGDGQRFKIVNQLLCGVHIAAAAEALALADSMGLDVHQVHEVLSRGAAASFMLEDRGARMISGNFTDVRSALSIFVKDMGLVGTVAREVAQQVPLASAAEELFVRGAGNGMVDLDDSVVYEILRGGEVSGMGR